MNKKLKLILLIGFTALAAGCSNSSDYTYTLVYEIYWNSNYTERKTISSDSPIIITSHRGTNLVGTDEDGWVEQTSAPIRKIKYFKRLKNENNI